MKTGARTVLHRFRTPGTYQVGPNVGNFLFVARQLHPGSDGWRVIGWLIDARFHPLRYPANV